MKNNEKLQGHADKGERPKVFWFYFSNVDVLID